MHSQIIYGGKRTLQKYLEENENIIPKFMRGNKDRTKKFNTKGIYFKKIKDPK
jgi:hypothetical protein